MSNGLINRQYVGARYVPKIMGEWNKDLQYEALSVVTYMGNSFTSKIPVPANVEINNEKYWVNTGNFNAQLDNINKTLNNMTNIVNDLNSKPINVLTLGVKNDGSEDCSSIINSASKNNALYFPIGTYRIDSTLKIYNSIYGYSDTTEWNNFNGCSIFMSYTTDNAIEIKGDSITLNNINLKCNNDENGILINGSHMHSLKNVTITNIGAASGIKVIQAGSRIFNIDNTFIEKRFENPLIECIGINIQNGTDNRITNTYIMGMKNGIVMNGGLLYGDNLHIWCGTNYTLSGAGEWWNNTMCINASNGSVFLNNAYLDTAHDLINNTNATININNLINWTDINNDSISKNGRIFTTNNNNSIINNGIVGGTMHMNLAFSNIAKYNNITCVLPENTDFTNLDNGCVPMLWFSDYKEYSLQRNVTANNYVEVCRFVGDGDIATIFTITDEHNRSTTITSTGFIGHENITRKAGTNDMPIYYKRKGNYVILYTTALDNIIYTNIKLEMSRYGGVVNMSMIKNNTQPFNQYYDQTDSTGLTEVSAS